MIMESELINITLFQWHMQKCYEDLGIREGELPIAEEISKTELSIPMYYGMTEEEVVM